MEQFFGTHYKNPYCRKYIFFQTRKYGFNSTCCCKLGSGITKVLDGSNLFTGNLPTQIYKESEIVFEKINLASLQAH